MKSMTSGAAILAAMMAVTPLRVHAQQGARAGARAGDGPRGAGVEMILRQRERLELTDQQVRQLDGIRREAVQRRTAHQAQMEELRSQVLAGELEPEALRDTVQSRRQAAADVVKQQRERVEAILNDQQKQQLEEWRGQARAFRMGRTMGMRGARGGMMGRQGFRRGGMGMRGPGAFAPGMRQRRMPGMGGRMGPAFRRGGRGGGPGFGPPEGAGFFNPVGPPDDSIGGGEPGEGR